MVKKITKKLVKSTNARTGKNIKAITVKNADGEPDTTATILVQNKISYTPKVSVIIPVYNVEKYLRECLDSVVNQTLREIEIICVDDGSTDTSLDILKEYASKDNRITVIGQQNLHAGVARNAGLAVARGEYLSFLDSDDFFELNMLAEMYSKAKENNSDVVACEYSLYDNQKNTITGKFSFDTKFINQSSFFAKEIHDDLFAFSHPNPWSKIFKHQLFIDNNLHFESSLRCNDFTCVYTAMALANKISIVNKPLIKYRTNQSGNVTAQKSARIDCFLLAISKLEQNLKKHNVYNALEQTFTNRIKSSFKYELSGCSDIQKDNVRIMANDILSQDLYFKLYEPRISVLMPAYNAEKFVAEAIESIINQTYKNFEFIIINDGSTDNTAKIIQKYADQDKRIRFINNKQNQGLIAVLNQGLDLCRCEYIARMDSDDISYLDRFEKQVKYLDEHPDVGLLSTWIEYFPKKQNMGKHKEFVNFFDILKGWHINHPTVMFRRDLFYKHNLKYDPGFNSAEDYELWSRVIRHTKIVNLQEVLLKYRKHGNSVCDTQRQIQNENSNKVKKNMLKHLYDSTDDKNFKQYIKKHLNENDYKLQMIPVVVASDNNYVKTLSVCLRSILGKTNAFIDFIILSDGITDANIKKVTASIKDFKNFKISFVDMQRFNLDKFPVIDRFNVSVFSRYFIPEICKDYDKIVYTDADVVFTGDISEYFNINLDGKGIAATPEELGAIRDGKYNHQARKELFGIAQSHLYFANGNLIISCDWWRKHNITEKLIKKTNELRDNLVCPDLDVMNVIFQNNYKRLDFKYCVTVHRYCATNGNQEMINGFKNPFIIHYSGHLKPWNTNLVLFFKEWNDIYKKTVYYSAFSGKIKPYLLFPYYLCAKLFFKYIKFPCLMLKNYGTAYLCIIKSKKLNEIPEIIADDFISLGPRCRPAHHLKKNKLKRHSLPFDWMINNRLDLIIETLKNKSLNWFYDFAEDTSYTCGGHRIVIDKTTQMSAIHHFPVEYSVKEYLPTFNAIFNRRKDRFVRILTEHNNICFVMNRPDTILVILKFIKDLHELYPKNKFTIVNVRQDETSTDIYKYKLNKKCTLYDIHCNDIHDIDPNPKTNINTWVGSDIFWTKLTSKMHFTPNINIVNSDTALDIYFKEINKYINTLYKQQNNLEKQINEISAAQKNAVNEQFAVLSKQISDLISTTGNMSENMTKQIANVENNIENSIQNTTQNNKYLFADIDKKLDETTQNTNQHLLSLFNSLSQQITDLNSTTNTCSNSITKTINQTYDNVKNHIESIQLNVASNHDKLDKNMSNIVSIIEHNAADSKNDIKSVKQDIEKTNRQIDATKQYFENNQVLYFSRFETTTRKERGMCDMVSAPNFEERFKKLMSGLPAESAETVVKIIRRLQMIKDTTNKLDLFTEEEKTQLKKVRNLGKEILKVSDNLYAYKNYMLPINHFEASVFVYNHGISQLNSVDTFKDKDILDIGGFIGDSVLMLAPLTSGKIHSFEATAENYNHMLKTIELNGIKNAIPVHTAVGDKPGEIELRFNGSASSQNEIMVKEPQYVEKCPVITIDDYVREHKLSVGLIKVDIEGAEQSFLRGAYETIRTQKPTLLISIYHNVDDFLDIKPMIESWNLGYKFKIFKPTLDSISGETLLICEQ